MQPDQVDHIWLRLRHPFRLPQTGHTCEWERYDYGRAGCTRCGALHRCSGSMVGCQCPLTETDDGGHVCLITGLCISEVRASRCEYVEHSVFEAVKKRPDDEASIFDRVNCVVANFLLSPTTVACRRLEHAKYIQKKHQAFWRVLKQCKRDHPYRLPDLCLVVAEVAQSEPPPCGLVPLLSGKAQHDPETIVRHSSCGISASIMQIYRMGFRKICQGSKFNSMVIGMLYMTRTGLSAGAAFHLPPTPHIHELLPSETYLNCLGVSNKVICDTENEIKSCIRTFAEIQARPPKDWPKVGPKSNVRQASAASGSSRRPAPSS